jgi:hypothetical protein
VTAVYIGAFAVGAISVLSALLLAEFSIGGGHGADGLPFVSLTSLSAALLGAGAGGLIGTWADLGGALSGVIAAVCAIVLLLGLQGLVLPYLRRQESNSHKGRISYIGLLGTVTLEVPSGGWGEVAFVDADGNRVRSRAVTAEPHALLKSTQVYISDVDADVVHVVSVEGAIPPPPAPERP